MAIPIKKALTFRASSIGDCLMGKYLLENIHEQYPNARYGVVVANRSSMIRDLFAAYPWIEVIEANRRSPRALFPLMKDFYSSDLVVTQYAGKHGGNFGFASKLIAWVLAKRGNLVGFTDTSRWNGMLYDHLLPVRPDQAVAEHEREALRAVRLSVPLPFPTLDFIRNDAVLPTFGLKTGEYIITHFFAGGAGRSIGPEKSRELLLALRHTIPKDISILVSGAAADRECALAIANGIEARVIAGEATLQEMMNLIKQSCGVVSVDTGVAHMTAQLWKPLLVLRTCLGPNWWFPQQYGLDASLAIYSCDVACARGHITRAYPACINSIDMQSVAQEAIRRFLPQIS